MIKVFVTIAMLLILQACSEKKNAVDESAFKIIDHPNTEVTDKVQRLEALAGFKNISLGQTLSSFNFGHDWAIKTKTDLFGRDYGDSIITAYNSSYHQQIGDRKIEKIELTFIRDTLTVIEIVMEKKTYDAGMLIKPNLYPILAESFGIPNKIKYGFAKISHQCNVLLNPILTPDSNSEINYLLDREHNPYFRYKGSEDHFIAAWQNKDIVMELIEGPTQVFEEGQSGFQYGTFEIIRYFVKKTSSVGFRICENQEKIQENALKEVQESILKKQKQKLKDEASKL